MYRYKHIQELVKSRSSVADSKCVTISVSKNEEYVIRYIAGYVYKSIRTKSLKYVQVNSRSSNPKVLEEVKHRKLFIDVIPVLVPDTSGSNIPSSLDPNLLYVTYLHDVLYVCTTSICFCSPKGTIMKIRSISDLYYAIPATVS